MDKSTYNAIADWLTDQSNLLRAEAELRARARLGLVMDTLAKRVAPVAQLVSSRSIVVFAAEPLGPQPWQRSSPNPGACLTQVWAAGDDPLVPHCFSPPDPVFAIAWKLLCDVASWMRPGEVTHTGFAIDFGQGLLAGWHAWTCRDHGDLNPCFVVRFGFGEPGELLPGGLLPGGLYPGELLQRELPPSQLLPSQLLPGGLLSGGLVPGGPPMDEPDPVEQLVYRLVELEAPWPCAVVGDVDGQHRRVG